MCYLSFNFPNQMFAKSQPFKFFFFIWGFFFILSALYSTLLHLSPLRFHCVRGCWYRTRNSCDFGIDCQTLYIITRLDDICLQFHLLFNFMIFLYQFIYLPLLTHHFFSQPHSSAEPFDKMSTSMANSCLSLHKQRCYFIPKSCPLSKKSILSYQITGPLKLTFLSLILYT